MNYSLQKKHFKTLNRRTFFLLIIKLSLFTILGSRLFNIQILNSKKYKTLSENNQINLEIIYPIRGDIKDRNGNIIATNNKVYDLYIIPEQSNNLEKTLNNLKNFINFDFKHKRQVIDLSKKIKQFERIKVLEDLSWEQLELIESNKNQLEGLHLQENYKRIYTQGNSLSHILGYISQPSQKDLILPYISKMPNLDIGKTGIEKFFNENLIGIAGQREVEVNAKGRLIREISRVSSKKGKDVSISIDMNLQNFTQNELKQFKAGAIVVMDINSGQILSMTSTPNYDPNLILKKPNQKYWNSLIDNSLSPLTNRSIQGLYSPGSTFKMIVAIAALKDNIINNKTTEFCNGKIEFGDRIYHCWKTKGHGKMNVENAIKESCDVFFYETARKLGINKISKLAKEFGLGEIYNIGIDGEKKGIVPNKKWKKNNLKESWYAGETLIAGIGQGYALSNPLQLAVMTSRIASNGKKIYPTLIKDNKEKKFNTINNIENYLPLIKKAMFNVVNKPGGTAYSSMSVDYLYSGKTGTSQVKKISLSERESEDFRKKEIEWKNKDHAIFVGYMPSDTPKYAISVVIEHGGSGASTAAPIAKRTFDYINSKKIL